MDLYRNQAAIQEQALQLLIRSELKSRSIKGAYDSRVSASEKEEMGRLLKAFSRIHTEESIAKEDASLFCGELSLAACFTLPAGQQAGLVSRISSAKRHAVNAIEINPVSSLPEVRMILHGEPAFRASAKSFEKA